MSIIKQTISTALGLTLGVMILIGIGYMARDTVTSAVASIAVEASFKSIDQTLRRFGV